MKTFVLVHGAWHGSWCWKRVANYLKQLGHKVYAIDLPGHGTHKIEFSHINLNSYVDCIKDFISHIDDKVILVGHSMAGIVISQVAEDIPQNINKLIYISAFVPDYTGSLIQEEKKALHPSVANEVIIHDKENEISITHSKKLKELFYGMCSQENSLEAIQQLQEEPLQPFLDSVSLSDKNFGKVKKIYIECLDDGAIHIIDQRRMHQKIACKKMTLKSDHSPFLSHPEQLVTLLTNENE